VDRRVVGDGEPNGPLDEIPVGFQGDRELSQRPGNLDCFVRGYLATSRLLERTFASSARSIPLGRTHPRRDSGSRSH
jgi:hypothetical protein